MAIHRLEITWESPNEGVVLNLEDGWIEWKAKELILEHFDEYAREFSLYLTSEPPRPTSMGPE